MLSFYARAHKLFILSSFFCFGFCKSHFFLNFVLYVMDYGSLLIFFTPSILFFFFFFPLNFFFSLPLSSFYFPSLTPSKCPTLHLLLHVLSLVALHFHCCLICCCSPIYHHLLPLPLIVIALACHCLMPLLFII